MSNNTIYQTAIVQDIVSYRADLDLSNETQDIMEYHWFLVDEVQQDMLTATCLCNK